jgi:hypothetical protein
MRPAQPLKTTPRAPRRGGRRYTSTALLSGLIGVATSARQVGLLRAGAWTARGLRVPARNALLADVVSPDAYGRAYGFERAMDKSRRDPRPVAGDRARRPGGRPRRDPAVHRPRPAHPSAATRSPPARTSRPRVPSSILTDARRGAACLAAAGVGIGCVETAEHAAVAKTGLSNTQTAWSPLDWHELGPCPPVAGTRRWRLSRPTRDRRRSTSPGAGTAPDRRSPGRSRPPRPAPPSRRRPAR